MRSSGRVRRPLSERRSQSHPHTRAGAKRERAHRALDRQRPPRVPRPAANRQPPPARTRPSPLRQALQPTEATPTLSTCDRPTHAHSYGPHHTPARRLFKSAAATWSPASSTNTNSPRHDHSVSAPHGLARDSSACDTRFCDRPASGSGRGTRAVRLIVRCGRGVARPPVVEAGAVLKAPGRGP